MLLLHQLLLHQLLSERNSQWWKHGGPSSLSNHPWCLPHIFNSLQGSAIHSSTARKAVSTQMETSKSFTGHILPLNFVYVMNIASMLTLKMMPSHTNCLRMGFLWEAQKLLQARWILWLQMADQVFTDSSSLLVLPGSPITLPKPLCLGALPGRRMTFLPSPNAFQLGYWEKWPEFNFFPGQAGPPAHAEPCPLTHAQEHHITCQFSPHPLLRWGPGPRLAGTRREATSTSPSSAEQHAGLRWPGPAPHRMTLN